MTTKLERVIAVDTNGRHFVNESRSCHDIVTAMFWNSAGKRKRFYFICDRALTNI